MRFGICGGPEIAGAAARSGFDYIELGLAWNLFPERAALETLDEVLRGLERAGIRSEALNGMLPGDLKVVGDESAVDQARQNSYLAEGFKRAKQVGAEIVVFGSGGSRRVPEGFSRSVAEDQIAEFLQRAGDAAGQHGVTIAIEPLNRGECNILNSVAEALAMAERVAHPHVQVLSDYYHVARDEQEFDETARAGSRLRHVHVAKLDGRRAPAPGDEGELRPYMTAVKRAGYDSRISIEGGWDDLEKDAAAALQALRDGWSTA